MIFQIYLNNNVDFIAICGDLNGRVGTLSDIVEKIDDVTVRKSIDKVKSGHGENLIEFVKDTKSVILNGRINPEQENFTFISSRGRSVVDYFITPQDCLQFCQNFSVDLMSSLLEKYDLYSLLSQNCKAPDHSLLTLQFRYSYIDVADAQHSIGDKSNEKNSGNRKMYSFENRPNGFLSSEMWKTAVANIIRILETNEMNQNVIDNAYTKLCKQIFTELDDQMLYKIAGPKSTKKFKFSKPYWTDELSTLWKRMSKCEKNF